MGSHTIVPLTQGRVEVAPWAYSAIVSGDWAFEAQSGSWGGFVWQNVPTPLNGDSIAYDIYLDAGTYTLWLLVNKRVAAGITDVYIDAVEVASFDLYIAVATRNQIVSQAGIVVATAGRKTLTFTLDGKNASASSYRFPVQWISLWKTGE